MSTNKDSNNLLYNKASLRLLRPGKCRLNVASRSTRVLASLRQARSSTKHFKGANLMSVSWSHSKNKTCLITSWTMGMSQTEGTDQTLFVSVEILHSKLKKPLKSLKVLLASPKTVILDSLSLGSPRIFKIAIFRRSSRIKKHLWLRATKSSPPTSSIEPSPTHQIKFRTRSKLSRTWKLTKTLGAFLTS